MQDKKCQNKSVNKVHAQRELDLNPAQALFKLNDPS